MTLLEEIQNGETETLEFKREIPSKDSKLMKQGMVARPWSSSRLPVESASS